MTCNPRHRPIRLEYTRPTEGASLAASRRFLQSMTERRSIRDFSDDPVPYELIQNAVATANAAPSGANRQPWRFVVVSDPGLKRRIREGAEEEERAFYSSRASEEWLEALEPLGTDWHKPFLESVPFVIVVFEVHRGPHGEKPYYLKESVGIAVGMLIAALHLAGLGTLTHTPSPMRFLNSILGRPPEEKPFVVIPVGWPAPDATVPMLHKKPLDAVLIERLTPGEG
jgi:iodotyrosine deiodinase